MQYRREDAEMQPQHNNNAGGLRAECKKGHEMGKKRGGVGVVGAEVRISRNFCQLVNLPLASSGHPAEVHSESSYVYIP